MTVRRVPGNGAKELRTLIVGFKNKVGKVGWLDGAAYPGGEYVAAIALQNELGNPAKHIPPRPFIRPTLIKNEKKYKKIAFDGSKRIFRNSATPDLVLDAIGMAIAGDIREAISKLWTPALSPLTVQRRLERKQNKTIGNLNKPLIDTGVMLTKVTNSVEQESL